MDDTQICRLSSPNSTFSHCDWTSGDGSSQDILQSQSCTQSQLCESHNLWISVSALEHKVAPRPHTFLLISGWCPVTKGVGSNNHVELLMLPWIPSGGKQTIPLGLGSCGEVGTCYAKPTWSPSVLIYRQACTPVIYLWDENGILGECTFLKLLCPLSSFMIIQKCM